jgi:hypothetical protein
MKELSRKIGRFVCSLGWHRRPFEKEPRPEGMTPEAYQFHHSRYYCTRCGVAGRLDAHGNLDPDGAGVAARAAW